jgi:tetratricopeptide (TPR) repeat protein
MMIRASSTLMLAPVAALVAFPYTSYGQAKAKASTADTYFQGYLLMDEGIKLLDAQDYAASYYKLRDANDIFDSVRATDPNWQPDIVDYRRKRVKDLMERARVLEVGRRDKIARNPGTINPSSAPPPKALPMNAAPAAPRPMQEVISGQAGALAARIKDLEEQNSALLLEIGTKDEQLRTLGSQNLDLANRQTKLTEDLKITQIKLETADATKKREMKEILQENEQLKIKLQETSKLAQDLGAQNTKLLEEVTGAYAQIKSLNEERQALVAEKATMEELLAGALTTAENKTVVTSNQKIQKMLSALQERVRDLQKERDDAKASEANLREQVAKDQKTIAELRTELDTARTELVTLKKQNRDYEDQMAAMQSRLSATERALGEAGLTGMNDTQALQENAMLREIVLKMIKQQAGRMKAKEQVVQLLENTTQETAELAKTLEEMSEPYQMTPAERAVLQATGSGAPLPSGTGVQIEIQGDIGGTGRMAPHDAVLPTGAINKENLPPILRGFATAAETHFRNSEFTQAEESYQRILEEEPRNVECLCNMAVVQLRQGKLKEAETHIKKAQAYRYNNDFAHYLSGVVSLRQGRYQQALESIDEGLKIKPDNADGHLSKGYILVQMKRYPEAEAAFVETLNHNPNCGDAHFNLATLYALSENPQKEIVRKHYRMALENGAAPDASLEGLLEN